MTESIKRVEVTDISEIQPFVDETVGAVKHRFGVYLIFIPLEDRGPSSFRTRNYCKIGRAIGVRVILDAIVPLESASNSLNIIQSRLPLASGPLQQS